jgi:hypothetical protein
MRSVLGTILDPAADKTLVTTLTVTLAMKGLLPGRQFGPPIGTDFVLSPVHRSPFGDNNLGSGCLAEHISILLSVYITSFSGTPTIPFLKGIT